MPESSPRSGRFLVVSVADQPDDVELIRFALEDAGLEAVVLSCDNADSLQQHLQRGPHIVLCNYNLPKFSPQAALELIAELGLAVPLVVVTRSIDEAAAVDGLRRSARNCFTKSLLATLPQVIRRVLADEKSAREARLAQQRLHDAHERLRAMSARMIGLQELQCQRVAAELHDGLGQTLTSALLHLDASERVSDAEAALICRRTASQLVRETLDQIRSLSFTLRPAQLDVLGLASAVRTAANMQLLPLGLVASVHVRGDLARAGATCAAVLYRVVVDALTNVVRHARPGQVRITLAMHASGRISATVLDDGVGFDVTTAFQHPDRDARTGLASMLEWSELAGGRLRIRSRPGRGTAVHVVL